MKIYIDLLPQEKKKELRRKKNFRLILREEIFFLIPLIVLIVILANVYYLVQLQKTSLVAAQASDKTKDKFQQLSAYEGKFGEANKTVAALLKIQTSHLHWETVLDELNGLVPDRVTLSEISSKNYQMALIGKAKTREDLLEFKARLDNSQCFQNVNMPLSDLVTKTDVDFQLDFTITKDCLLKK